MSKILNRALLLGLVLFSTAAHAEWKQITGTVNLNKLAHYLRTTESLSNYIQHLPTEFLSPLVPTLWQIQYEFIKAPNSRYSVIIDTGAASLWSGDTLIKTFKCPTDQTVIMDAVFNSTSNVLILKRADGTAEIWADLQAEKDNKESNFWSDFLSELEKILGGATF